MKVIDVRTFEDVDDIPDMPDHIKEHLKELMIKIAEVVKPKPPEVSIFDNVELPDFPEYKFDDIPEDFGDDEVDTSEDWKKNIKKDMRW